MKLPDARRVWAARQKLGSDALLTDVPGGWCRAIGGVDPHLALRARVRGHAASDVYAALADGDVQVVPGVRGCIWFVPRQDVSLALRISAQLARRRTLRDCQKLGQSEVQLQALGDAIVGVLSSGGLTTEGVRDALPAGAVVAFGDAGKKLGVTTNVPPALRLLEWTGRVRRRQAADNLDNTYVWCLPDEDPLQLGVSPTDPVDVAIELARRFFAWAAPASLDEFVQWYGGGKTDARKAIAALGLKPVDVDGVACFTDGLDPDPVPAGPHFLTAQDNLLSLRSSLAALAHPAFHDVPLMAMGKKTVPLRDARWMHQRLVVEDGELIGLWEWDRDTQDVVVAGFRGAIERPGALADFIRGQLGGEARSNAIDGAARQRQRVDAVAARAR